MPNNQLPELIQTLLIKRGINNQEQINSFLCPDYDKHLHDPFLMKDMDKAVDRILLAINNNEKILVFGDYDADGVPATAVITEFFDQIGFKNYSVYIPDRHLESYGLNISQIEEFILNKVNLIITVDCGITACQEVLLAKENNVDVIITDHHLPQETLPQAVAVVDPKRNDDSYPFKDLCGAGVAFKLVKALIIKGNFDLKDGWEKWLLDLVAIATVSDMVSLLGENRVLVYYGLIVLNKTKRIGLLSLFRSLKLKIGYINEDDIGFMIGPRINSASRMAHAIDAYNLLVCKDKLLADELVNKLEGNNKRRKDLISDILLEVDKKIRALDYIPEIIFIGHNDWHPGILGLVASRIVDSYKKSAFVWGKNGNNEIKGSCRSNGSINVVDLMSQINLFIDFGGHSQAGGFSITEDKIDYLEQELIRAFELVDKTELSLEASFDSKLALNEVSWLNFREINKLAPFGLDNPKPIFLFEDIVIKQIKSFGQDNNHLELVFENGSKKIQAISFFSVLSEGNNFIFNGIKLEPEKKINLLANFEKSVFRNFPELRLRVVDILPTAS